MKAFITSTSWSRVAPDVVRVELEVRTSENTDGMGIKMLSGNYVYLYGESRWERFIARFKRGTK